MRLEIFDVLGQRVRTLLEGTRSAGFYQVDWDGRNDAASPVGSGVYFYRIEALDAATAGAGFVETRRMLLIK